MLRLLFLFLIFMGLYRFVVRFVLPLLGITNAVRTQMKNMQQRTPPAASSQTPNARKERVGDYIDYEEVK